MPIPNALRPLALAALFAACSRGATATTAPDLRATVTEVARPDASMQALVRVYVDRAGDSPGVGPRMPITLTGSSEVYVEQAGKARRADYRALRAGQAVAIWFVEGTDETNPAARQARKIVIQDGTS